MALCSDPALLIEFVELLTHGKLQPYQRQFLKLIAAHDPKDLVVQWRSPRRDKTSSTRNNEL